jgi:hypothetical protein
MTDAQLTQTRRQGWAVWLLSAGVPLVIVGLLGGLVAKRSADLASFAASQPTRFLTPDSSAPMASQIALNFDPSSAHFIPPDYTVFWLGMIVVALGLIAVLAGIVVVLIKRRMA